MKPPFFSSTLTSFTKGDADGDLDGDDFCADAFLVSGDADLAVCAVEVCMGVLMVRYA
jgi:hypothetical protein